MSMLTNPSELVSSFNYKGLIYGQPGIGKTTVALSASNPVLLDFDKGLHRVEKIYQVPSLQPTCYQDVINLLNSNELAGFDTIVIDTLGKLIDMIISSNHVPKKNDGCTPSMQGWSVLKVQFQNLLKMVASKNKNILFVAHEKEEKTDDNIVKRIDVSGSSGKDLLKELDFMGYMQAKGKKRTISFSPEESFYAKNSMKLNDIIEVPDTANGNTFFVEKIEGAIKEKMEDDNKMKAKYDDLVLHLEKTIKGADTPEKLTEIKSNCYDNEEYPHIWNSRFVVRNLISNFSKEKGWIFDADTKSFKEVVSDGNTKDNA